MQGVVAGSTVFGLAPLTRLAIAQTETHQPSALRGTEFNLDSGGAPINYTGAARHAYFVLTQNGEMSMMSGNMSMMNGGMGMMVGFGLVWVLVIVVLILVIAALIKYLRSDRK